MIERSQLQRWATRLRTMAGRNRGDPAGWMTPAASEEATELADEIERFTLSHQYRDGGPGEV